MDKNLMDEIAAEAKRRRAGNASLEEIIQYMKDAGFDFIDCMVAVHKMEEIRPSAAKLIVHNSAAWSDSAKSREDFQEAVVREVDEFLEEG